MECLCCGQRRILARTRWRFSDAGECPRCGYLGWAPTGDLSERARNALRHRPPQRRRLYAV